MASTLALHCGGESTSVHEKHASGAAGAISGRGGRGNGTSAGRAGAFSSGGCAPCMAGSGGSGDGGAGVGEGGAPNGGDGDAGAEPGGAGPGGQNEAGSAGDAARGGSAGSTAGTAAGGRGAAGSGGTAVAGEAGAPAVDGLGIVKVALYQAVEIPLMVGGAELPANENAPVMAERDALVRVWVAPGAAFEPRAVAGALTITSTAGVRVAKTTKTIAAASTDGDLASSLNFTVRANEMAATTTVVLDVHETTGTAESLAHWPATGARVLGAQVSNGPFLVTLVPLIANGVTPDTSETVRSRFERYLDRVYPATNVDVSVRGAVTLDATVFADGTGWDAALEQLLDTRSADAPAQNVYYYGVLTPGTTFDAYCQSDCVVGLSNVASRTQTQLRGAIGTGYFATPKDTFSQETLAHELGHALGRDHSPCGTDDPDPLYPYKDGGIGVYGYDGARLLSPSTYTDLMGYCVPVWISDYTYAHLFDRIAYANGSLPKLASAPRVVESPQRLLRLGVDGRLHWGHETYGTPPTDAPTVALDLLDASGHVLSTLTVPFAGFDHLPGGFLSVPTDALGIDVASVRVLGRTLDVP
ncbi:MAG TPA: M66 family metalloprotease [Polyangiaceae bacterium]|jgi:hypothetical protein|nr:M66 family metalloprotease [Polyangiaceae bacterium]